MCSRSLQRPHGGVCPEPGTVHSLEQGCGLTFGGLDLGMGLGSQPAWAPRSGPAQSSKCPETGRERPRQLLLLGQEVVVLVPLAVAMGRSSASPHAQRFSQLRVQAGGCLGSTQGVVSTDLTPCPRANVLARSLSTLPFSCYFFIRWPWHWLSLSGPQFLHTF